MSLNFSTMHEISEFHYHHCSDCCHHIVFVDCHDDHAGKSSSEGGSGDPFLLACRFFDRECAGHLDADDLEEIVFMVSDSISREPHTVYCLLVLTTL